MDRKKHIFKLAQGEYIAPEKIENIYTRSDAVAQLFVHGDSLQVGGVNFVFMCLEAFTFVCRRFTELVCFDVTLFLCVYSHV